MKSIFQGNELRYIVYTEVPAYFGLIPAYYPMYSTGYADL